MRLSLSRVLVSGSVPLSSKFCLFNYQSFVVEHGLLQKCLHKDSQKVYISCSFSFIQSRQFRQSYLHYETITHVCYACTYVHYQEVVPLTAICIVFFKLSNENSVKIRTCISDQLVYDVFLAVQSEFWPNMRIYMYFANDP